MLKNIPPFISGEILNSLSNMGHGDQLALVDRNFPGHHTALKTHSKIYHYIAGVDCKQFLKAIIPLFPFDEFSIDPFVRMEVDNEPQKLFPVHQTCIELFNEEYPEFDVKSINRMEFYQKAISSYVIIQVDDFEPYACFLLKKGIVSPR